MIFAEGGGRVKGRHDNSMRHNVNDKTFHKSLGGKCFSPMEDWFVLASRCNITCTDELINRTELLSSCNQQWLMVGTKKVDYHDKFTDAEKISPAWEMDRICSETSSVTLFKKESTGRLKAPSTGLITNKWNKNKFAIQPSTRISCIRAAKLTSTQYRGGSCRLLYMIMQKSLISHRHQNKAHMPKNLNC